MCATCAVQHGVLSRSFIDQPYGQVSVLSVVVLPVRVQCVRVYNVCVCVCVCVCVQCAVQCCAVFVCVCVCVCECVCVCVCV